MNNYPGALEPDAKELNTPRLETSTKPRKCPACGSRNVLLIIHGNPSPIAVQLAKEGRYLLGGGITTMDDPTWGCADCGARIYLKT